ncbi:MULTISPECIES: hypothetical protein [unclassified Sinorhizobium]|uniref:hypothetical protein n=1 Tax=unclassified Sinorhizobium TaxID=2613772 RepID=UPI0035250F7A
MERSLECEEVLEAAFNELVRRAIAAGWRQAEVALVLADIADDYVMDLAERQKRTSLDISLN